MMSHETFTIEKFFINLYVSINTVVSTTVRCFNINLKVEKNE